MFDEHVIIFSDKHCQLADSGNLERDWQRWFKKAIWKSAEQAWGAERWIREQPDRIFLDRKCEHRLPVPLPVRERATFHLVVVAHGVSQRVRQMFGATKGTLFIDSSILGLKGHSMPFFVGDLAPDKTFVHVFDDDSLDTLMATRDTISDFVAYLSARDTLLRGKVKISSTGEEQLLGLYLTNMSENRHDFVFPIAKGNPPTKIFLDEGHWEEFQQAPERIAQLKADRISYAWDKLIEKFNFYALRGEQHFVTAGGITDTERVLRFMAREPRWKRRYLAKSLIEMLQTTPVDQRRLRVMPPVDDGDPYFVFLLFPQLYAKTDDEYRAARRGYLEACCVVTKSQYPDAKDIVGIATESGVENNGRSEDCLYLDAREWTSEMQKRAQMLRENLGILTKGKQVHEHMEEYPSVGVNAEPIKNPRNKPCPCGSGKKFKKCCGAPKNSL